MSYNRPRGERSLLIERILREAGEPMSPASVVRRVEILEWDEGQSVKSRRSDVSKKLGQMAYSNDIPVRKTARGLYAYDKSAVIGR